MVYKNCGSELSDGAKFCGKCGSSQKPLDTTSKQLNDYLEVLKHIKDSNNNKSSSVDSKKVKEVEEKVCTTIGGIIILLLYIIGVGLSLKNVIIGSIIGSIVGWLISKVIGFLYKIISCSGNFVKEVGAEYWKQEPVYIKVNQLQETACQKYMHMSIAEFEAEKINVGFGENRRINDLLKLSEQKPTASLEQLIDIYYSSLFRQIIIERIFALSDELTKLKRSHKTENNKYPAETMNLLYCCEDSLEKLIDDADDMSDLELLERLSEASDIFHALCKELEEIKNKEKLEAERLKKEEEQRRKKEEERRKREAEQRRKDFPPTYYTDIHEANIKLYELKYNKFYQEQLEKFEPIRLATDALAKEFYTYEDKKETNYKLEEAKKKLIAVICHTIDAIRYDDDSLIAKLPAERAVYKKMLEEALQSSSSVDSITSSNASSNNYLKTNSNASLGFASNLIRYGFASAGRKILYKCGDCAYYRDGRCCEKNKNVSKSGGSCSRFKYNG